MLHHTFRPAVALAAAVLVNVSARADQAYFVGTGINPRNVIGYGMSSDGRFFVGNEFDAFHHVVRWTSENDPLVLDFNAVPTGVSRDGSIIVGDLRTPVNPFIDAESAFRWTATSGVELLAPGYEESGVTDVSDDGNTIVGGLGKFEFGRDEAFRWTPTAGLQPLGIPPGSRFGNAVVSSDGSIIVGNVNDQFRGYVPFRWTEETGMQELGVRPQGVLDAFAHAGTPDMSLIVGQLGAYPDVSVPARWTQETGWIALPDLEGGDIDLNGPARATGVSADGSVIVGRGVDESGPEPFIWDAVHGTRNLTALLRDDYGLAASLTGWNLTEALHMSDDGRTIAGYGRNPSGQLEYWIAYLGVATGLAGDFSGNGTVDADDLSLWKVNFGAVGSATRQQGDADEDLDVDGADFLVWQRQLGSSTLIPAAALPEPASAALWLIAPLALASTARQRAATDRRISGV